MSAIKLAKEDGITMFDILGASDRLQNRFKPKFNPVLKPYFYVIKGDLIFDIADIGQNILAKIVRMGSLEKEKKDYESYNNSLNSVVIRGE